MLLFVFNPKSTKPSNVKRLSPVEVLIKQDGQQKVRVPQEPALCLNERRHRGGLCADLNQGRKSDFNHTHTDPFSISPIESVFFNKKLKVLKPTLKRSHTKSVYAVTRRVLQPWHIFSFFKVFSTSFFSSFPFCLK